MLCFHCAFNLSTGTEYENMTVVDTVLNAVTHPTHALTYSYASLALNNHFFLDHLVLECFACLCIPFDIWSRNR